MSKLTKPGMKIRVGLRDGRTIPAEFVRTVNSAVEVKVKCCDLNPGCPEEHMDNPITIRALPTDLKEA